MYDYFFSEVISYLLYKYAQTSELFVKNEKDQDFFLLSKTYGPAQYDYYGKPQYTQYSTIPSSYYSSQKYNHVGLPLNVHNSSYFPQDQQQRSSSTADAFNPPVQHYRLIAAAIPPILQSVWWNHRDRTSRQASFPHIVQHRARVRRQTTTDSQVKSKN